jgi:hypothetical protein
VRQVALEVADGAVRSGGHGYVREACLPELLLRNARG